MIVTSILVFILFCLIILINQSPLNSFFSQDDFYHIRQIMNLSFFDLFRVMIPAFSPEQTFYRPLSREVFNILMYKTFGLNAFVFHFINFSFILVNGLLFYKLYLKVFKNFYVFLFGLLIYLLSSIHSVQLYYLASVQTMISTFFGLLCLLNFNFFLTKSKEKYYFLTLVLYCLAILSHESSVVFLPILGLLYLLLLNKIEIKKIFIIFLPFVAISLLRYYINIYILPLPEQQVYKPSLSPLNIFNTFSWFTLWSLGYSEILVDFMNLKFQINPNFVEYYPDYYKVMLISAGGFITVFSMIGFITKFKFLFTRQFWFLLLAYIFSLTPFLFFPSHKYVYYLTFSILWFSALLAYVLSFLNKKSLMFNLVWLFFITYILLSVWTVNLNKDTYWAAKRAAAAKMIVNQVTRTYPIIEEDKSFYIIDDPNYPDIAKEWGSSSKQVFFILSGSDAFKLIYRKSDLNVYYQYKDSLKDLDKDNLLFFNPIFDY